MKQIISLIITLSLSIVCKAQIPKLKQIKNLKESEIIIGLSGNEEIDKNLKNVVEKFWNICPITKELPLEEAKEKAKKSDNIYVIYLDSYSSRSFKKYIGSTGNTDYYFRNISEGYFIGLSSGKRRPIIYSGIPAFEDKITDEVIAHGVNYMQQIFQMMLENKVNATKTLKIIRKNSVELKDKTLYIPKWWIDEKVSDKITQYYKGKYKIVSHFEWAKAILNKEAGIAYSIIIPTPVGGKYLYQHHLCDAETGKIYGVTRPKGAAVEMFGINLSSSNKGYVAKKNLKQYNKILNGK